MKSKRHIVFCIILSLCLSICSINSFNSVHAANDVSRAEWLGALVETFNMTVEDDNYPDNYFNDLDSSSDYYYNMLLAVQFGLVNVEAGGNVYPEAAVTREFAVSTLNYCLGFQLDENASYSFKDTDEVVDDVAAQVAIDHGWIELVNGEFQPDKELSLSEKSLMLKDAAEIWASIKVDQNYNNTCVFADGVKEIPNDTSVSLLEDGRISIVESPINVSVGDKIAVYLNDIPCVYDVTDIEKDGTNIIVTGSSVEKEEAFEEIDMQGTLDASAMDFGDVPEGLVIDYSEEDDEIESVDNVINSDAQAESLSLVRKTVLSSKKTIKPNKKTKLSVSGKYSVGDGQTVAVDMKMKNLKIDYAMSLTGDSFVMLSGDTDFSCSASFDTMKAVLPNEIELIPSTVPGVGGFNIIMELAFEGKFNVKTTGYLCTGVAYNPSTGLRILKDFKAKDFKLNLTVEATAGICARLGITEKTLPFNGYFYVKIGGKGSLSNASYGSGNPKNCSSVVTYLYASAGATAKIKIGSYSNSIDYTYEIYGENNSPFRIYHHYEDNVEVPECTRPDDFKNATGHGPRAYYTKYDSRFWGSGLYGYGASGLDAEGKPVVIYTYTLDDDNNATITSYKGNARYLTIPDTIDGYPVIAIGANAFKGNNYLYEILMPDAITSIGNRAFANCNNLSNINLPKSLATLGSEVFYDDDKITNIEIPKSLDNCYSTYGEGPFGNCSGLKEVKFETGVTEISQNLLNGCDGIEEVTIPDTVTVIELSSFKKCEYLITVNIPNTVTKISDRAFANCNNLSNIKLPKSLVILGSEVFYDDDKITEIEIPKALDKCYSTYGEGPFGNCSGLKEVKFETGVTEISQNLLNGCDGIEEVTIPDTVTVIELSSFKKCENLITVNIPNTVTKISDRAFANCNNLSNIKLPKSLVILGSEVFYDDDKITNIEIPKSLDNCYSTYGEGPFGNCSGLKEVKFETGVTEISQNLLNGCDGIEGVTIPDTITVIEDYAFKNCENLKSINIPDSVTNMGTSIFSGCTNLEKVHLPNIRINIPLKTFDNCKSLSEINFPETLEIIGESSFYNCTSLKEVVLPSKVNTINSSAFTGCTALTKVVIPASVRTINGSAFSHCEALTDLSIAEGITEIKGNVFEYNKALQKVTLPDSLKTLGEKTFQYCDNLSEVNMGAGVKTVPKYCFFEDPALLSIVLPQQMTTVGEFAFANCTKFTDITLNRNISSVAKNAFSYPDKLTIHGIAGTYAENFANDNNITFKAINSPATALKLSRTEYRLAKTATLQLTASITPVDSSDELTWLSTNEDIATVDSKTGLVKAIAVGNSEIIAMIGNITETCELTVYKGVTGVGLNVTSKELVIGDTLQLTEKISPSDATNKNVIWRSSNETVADVNETGLVTAKGLGTADITVKTEDGEYEKTCSITVKEIAVTGVSLNAKNVTIGIGKVYKLVPTIEPDNAANKEVTWTSSKLDVATVEDGIVTGVGEGQTIIIVKTVDGSKTATCTVTVIDKATAEGTVTLSKDSASETTISVKGIVDSTVTGAVAEYAIVEKGVELDSGIEWQSSSTFTGLKENTAYVAYGRIAGSDDYLPGNVSEGLDVCTSSTKDYTPGDLNGDSSVNSTDVILLRRYIAGGYNVTINEKAADVNADGSINSTDVILIRRYIAGGYGVVLK